jgi:hypothetical protein
LKAFIDSYLSEWNQTSPDQGCLMTTISSEMGLRGHNSSITDEVLNARLKQVETALGNPNAGEQSLVLMSTLVGRWYWQGVWRVPSWRRGLSR